MKLLSLSTLVILLVSISACKSTTPIAPPQITASPTLSSMQQLAVVTHIAPERFITSKVHAQALNQTNVEKKFNNELASLRSRNQGPSLLRIGATLALAGKLNVDYGLSDVAALTVYDTIRNGGRIDEDELNKLTQISTTDETILEYKESTWSNTPAPFQYRIAIVVEENCDINCGKAQLLSAFTTMIDSYIHDGVIPRLKSKDKAFDISIEKRKDDLPEIYYDDELQQFVSNYMVYYTSIRRNGKNYETLERVTESLGGIASTSWQGKKVFFTGIDTSPYSGQLGMFIGAGKTKDIPSLIKKLSGELADNVYLYMPLKTQPEFTIEDNAITGYSSICVGGGFYHRAEYSKVFDLDCGSHDYTPPFQHHIK